jgi:hypothetical protein
MKIPWWNAAFPLLMGIAVGFLLAGRPKSRGITGAHSIAEVGPNDLPVSISNNSNPKHPFYFEDGLVRIPKDQFTKVMDLATSTSLQMSTFKPIENGRIESASFDGIASSLRMNEEEANDFRDILSGAASARVAWEKEHVKAVRLRPANWEIRVPGDGGDSIQELREALERKFGKERAGQIELLGNFDGFFRGDHFLPEFLHGVIQVCAKPMNQGKLVLEIKAAEKTTRIDLDQTYLNHDEFIERYAPHLGGLAAIRAEAEALGK